MNHPVYMYIKFEQTRITCEISLCHSNFSYIQNGACAIDIPRPIYYMSTACLEMACRSQNERVI